ncbi:transposase family protein [Actinokineospora auranticolor]|uniref:DDE superfamily endonuclease n=1 Tax=Actinokineospora auranticolor TaxID=155976 RepID=A0A2S6GRM4_9PSEU|nr:transposase family protein [Actinokineospora auranticolor]PPK67771.1 DDE superfamily endonuclease [Actinokineospora auranticolor]
MVTLAYLRRRRVQAELAEAFEVSQSTISRATAAVTPLLAGVLEQCVPTADDLDDRSSHIVDGTLLPCWSWASRPESFSGKHRTTGLTVQVVRTLDGRLRWVSDPLPGSRNDIVGLKASRVLDGRDPSIRLGDKGYIGSDILTPIRKPRNREQPDRKKEFNRHRNSIRVVVERAIAQLKTWRILHTDYRRPVGTFTDTISAVIGLYFYAAE